MSTNLPDEPVSFVPAEERISVGRPRATVSVTEEDKKVFDKEDADKAKYKIEVTFDYRRSSLPHKPSPVAILIWESGRRLHGGGDEKMYWCGYSDCRKPIPTDDFGFMHLVCRHCQREQFPDPVTKRQHIDHLIKEGRPLNNIDKLPCVSGEIFANLTPSNLAELVAKTWYQLGGEADVYFKYARCKIRYDSVHETTKDMDNLERARIQRKPGSYTLSAIRKDIANGADLRRKFLAMIVA